MSNLDRAVKETIAYSAYFNYHLLPEEIHHWLITSQRVSFKDVCSLCNYQTLPLTAINIRDQHLRFSSDKLKRAQKISSLLSIIPTIHLIAVTGSVAVKNAKKLDDIDLLIVTSNYSLWFTRPFVLLILALFSHRRLPGQSYLSAAHSFCPNLWLEHRSLAVPKQKRNLYTAHEVLYVTPVFDRSNTHHHFISRNSWVKKYLANAYPSPINLSTQEKDHLHKTSPLFLLLYPLNLLSYLIQYLYMKPRITTEDVSLQSAYFHTQDFANKIEQHLKSV